MMANLEKEKQKTTPSRRGYSESGSQQTGASRPSFPHRLAQVFSSYHLDEVSKHQRHTDNEETVADDKSVERPELIEKDAEDSQDIEEAISDGVDTIPNVRMDIKDHRDIDVEIGVEMERAKSSKSARSARDPNLVSWEGPDDLENPKNWPMKRKWAATFVVSSFTFISPVSSSMVAPALSAIGKDLKITSELELFLTLSIFVLAYAIGPLFIGPISEMYGRVYTLQLSNLVYLFFNLGCGLAQSKGQLIAFRFLAGLGGSAPMALGGGVLSDLFTAEERGKAISIYSLAPLLGPAVGPIAGGYVAEKTSYRWIFYATTIADALIQLSGLFFLQETYAPVLLHKKKLKLIKETGNETLYTEYDRPDRIWKTLQISLTRPFRLLGTQIIVQVLALYMAYLYGIMYLILSTFPTLWTDVYHESTGIGGLNYISLGIGFFLGSQICAPFQDRIYRALKKRNGGVGKPEFRVPLMNVGAILVPVGLFWYGWSAQAKIHWVMPNIGAIIFSAGTIVGFQCIQTYIVDSYTRYAASALAAAAVLRSLAGFAFPLFAPSLFAKLHYGWGSSVLGFIAIVLGWPAPILLWKFGETLRKRSTFAAG